MSKASDIKNTQAVIRSAADQVGLLIADHGTSPQFQHARSLILSALPALTADDPPPAAKKKARRKKSAAKKKRRAKKKAAAKKKVDQFDDDDF